VLPMRKAMKSWHSAEQWMLGSMVPALMALVCIWLPLGPTPTAFAYFTAIAILIALLLVGVAADNADRLFDAFFSTKSGGMGTSPSIRRSIIDAHGGRLSVGPGATFQFALPLRREDDSP
jgi:hypothetical protein